VSAVEVDVLRRPVAGPFALGLAVVVLTAAFALLWGAADIPPDAIGRIVLYRLGLPIEADWPRSWSAIVWEVRLPRVLLAGLTGAVLAMAGATLADEQGRLYHTRMLRTTVPDRIAGRSSVTAVATFEAVPVGSKRLVLTIPDIQLGAETVAITLPIGLSRS
jgi:hypothetical protein